jgi:hypothetical protein
MEYDDVNGDIFTGRYGHTSNVVENNTVIVYGGRTEDAFSDDYTWIFNTSKRFLFHRNNDINIHRHAEMAKKVHYYFSWIKMVTY